MQFEEETVIFWRGDATAGCYEANHHDTQPCLPGQTTLDKDHGVAQAYPLKDMIILTNYYQHFEFQFFN